RLGGGAGVLAAVVGGLVCMGADPPAANPDAKAAALDAAIDKAFPTPRLYKVEVKGDLHSGGDGFSMCLGAEALRKTLDPLMAHPEMAAGMLKGCTHSTDHKANGSMRMEMTCDRAAGAFATSRMVIF